MPPLQDVNTTDLYGAVALGCQAMAHALNRDDDQVPFFAAQAWPTAWLRFSPAFSEAHVPGRHLNALLSAEDALGLVIDEEVIAADARAAFRAYAGPVPLPLGRETPTGPQCTFLPHNLREGFHALYALAAYRGCERAVELARASIAAIERYWSPAGWDRPALEALGVRFWADPALDTFVGGLGRAIGPLVKLYRATGLSEALALAARLAEQALSFFREDGSYDVDRFGSHTHSTTCTLSGLAQLAQLTGDVALLERVRAFYDRGAWQLRDALGWVIESALPDALPDRGEINNTGDLVETALILGAHGWPGYYGDAERMVRGHLLPAQLRDTSFIAEPDHPEAGDGLRDVAARLRGAFGFPAPYGHLPLGATEISFNYDIVGGAVGSLCAVWRACVTRDATGHHVNLLFDRDTPDVAVESPYTHSALRLRVKRPAPLWVRLPEWAPLSATIEQLAGVEAQIVGEWLLLPRPPVNRWLTLDWPLAEREIALRHRTRTIRARLRGDAVAAMTNDGADLTFFPPL